MAYTTEGIRNIALAGHSAAGKTTLFEALLHAGGTIQTLGSVVSEIRKKSKAWAWPVRSTSSKIACMAPNTREGASL